MQVRLHHIFTRKSFHTRKRHLTPPPPFFTGAKKSKGKGKKMVVQDDEEEEWSENKDAASSAKDEDDESDCESASGDEDDDFVVSDSDDEEDDEEDEDDASDADALEDSDDEDDGGKRSKKSRLQKGARAPRAARPPRAPRGSAPAKTSASSSTSSSSVVALKAKATPAANRSASTITPSAPQISDLFQFGAKTPFAAGTSSSSKPAITLAEGVSGFGAHEHDLNSKFNFLKKEYIMDKNRRRPDHPEYNPRTLYVPPEFMKNETPAQQQWWKLKSDNLDTVLFFKVGKFYELFHMDADVGMNELDLIYMKGEKAHSGFPEVSYGKFSSILVSKGYRVARVEQTETPDMLKNRNERGVGVKDKVVLREMCSIMSKGTRTYCHLDDLSLLDEGAAGQSGSVLMCLKELLILPSSEEEDDVEAMGGVTKATPDASHATPEYGICLVDTVIGTVILAQFSDDKQRTRLRTLVARYTPSEVLLEQNSYSEETLGAIRLLVPKAVIEHLRNGEMPREGQETVQTLKSGCYFGAKSADTSSWPPLIQAVIQGGSFSELALCALGGCIWQLKRSLIDYEILSMGRVEGYVPPDDATSASASLIADAHGGGGGEGGVAMDVDSDSIGSSSAVGGMGGVGAHDVSQMTLDAISLSNLEILTNNFDRTEKGSLWHFMNRCKTAFGKRLLQQWICHPLCRPADIAKRAAAIEELLTDHAAEADAARAALKGVPDLERLLARVHSNGLKKKGPVEHPDARAIMFEDNIYNSRKIKDFSDILTGFESVLKIATIFPAAMEIQSSLLRRAVKPPAGDSSSFGGGGGGSSSAGKGGLFPGEKIRALLAHFRNIFDEKQAKKEGNIKPKPGVDEEYDGAVADVKNITKDLDDYLVKQKALTGISSIVYWGNNKDRFQMEIPNTHSDKVPSKWTTKSQKKTHRRYWTPYIEEKLKELIEAEGRVEAAQKDTLRRVFEKFDQERATWRDALTCVALLDALLSLASISSLPNYCWPDIRVREEGQAAELNIQGGRHPMLEYTLSQNNDGEYIPNTVVLGGGGGGEPYLAKLLLLSGPNMGGKSTLLRQTCLIAIMAQLGCKVPADSVTMTPVDRVFTRVGASDRILAGQSTFFVELAETATILKQATQDSLCILDELGRGTATFDGTAIAHAVVDHLVKHTRCRGLFATHYHSLVDDWHMDPRVRLGHMECVVQEVKQDAVGGGGGGDGDGGAEEEEVTFLYHLADGSSPRSYGINVGRLAQLPIEVIQMAARQSKAFEEQQKANSLAAANGGAVAIGGAAGAEVASRDAMCAFFDRLVSLAHSDSPTPELVYHAQVLWERCKSQSQLA